MGFARSAAFMNDPVDAPLEHRLPVDEIEASITDDAVESLKVTSPKHYETLYCMYASGVGADETAALLSIGRSTVFARLAGADWLLARWFADRAARQAAAKRSFTA